MRKLHITITILRYKKILKSLGAVQSCSQIEDEFVILKLILFFSPTFTSEVALIIIIIP